MANSVETSDPDYADKLWQAADNLRGTVDSFAARNTSGADMTGNPVPNFA